jgi:hypothetical protein
VDSRTEGPRVGRYHGGSLCVSSEYFQTLGGHPLTSAPQGYSGQKWCLPITGDSRCRMGSVSTGGWSACSNTLPSRLRVALSSCILTAMRGRCMVISHCAKFEIYTNHIGMPLIDPIRAWWQLRLTRGERCRSHLFFSSKNKICCPLFSGVIML